MPESPIKINDTVLEIFNCKTLINDYFKSAHPIDTETLEKNTYDVLLAIGGRPGRRGFLCIIKSMVYLYTDTFVRMTGDYGLYDTIAQLIDSTDTAVERNIRFTVSTIMTYGNKTAIEAVFGQNVYANLHSKAVTLTNRDFLLSLFAFLVFKNDKLKSFKNKYCNNIEDKA